jgi:hypothetical protein
MHPLTKKTVLKTVHDLTEMMDKTIKSLKGSPEYAENQGLLVTRFYKLLNPYKALMEKWVNKLSTIEFREKDTKILAVHMCFLNLEHNQDPRQLNPSGSLSIPSVTVDSMASFSRHFDRNKDKVTLEDLFSLIHQNILIATISLGKSAQIQLKDLPVSLKAIHQALAEKSYVGRASITHVMLMNSVLEYPHIYLNYNMPMRNHSAKFLIDYNQEVGSITLNIKFFGHNGSGRMHAIANFAQIEGDLLKIKTVQEPKYNDKTMLLEWAWVIHASQVAQVTEHLHVMLQDYLNTTYLSDASAESFRLRKHIDMILERHQNFHLPQPENLPEPLDTFIHGLPLEEKVILMGGKSTAPSKMTLLQSTKDAQSIQLVYLLSTDGPKTFPKTEFSLRLGIDYHLSNHTMDLHIMIAGGGKLWHDIEPLLLAADLDSAILKAQTISPPQFNEKTGLIEWVWRFNNTDNLIPPSELLINRFIEYTCCLDDNIINNFITLFSNYEILKPSPAMYEHIIRSVQVFFQEKKNIRREVLDLSNHPVDPRKPAKTWVTLDELKRWRVLPETFLPAAESLHLFDKPAHGKALSQEEQSAMKKSLDVLRGAETQTVSNRPGPLGSK